MFVDNSSASRLNLVLPRLDFTLILHTALGKDHFISVTGEYRTSIPSQLDMLTGDYEYRIYLLRKQAYQTDAASRSRTNFEVSERSSACTTVSERPEGGHDADQLADDPCY